MSLSAQLNSLRKRGFIQWGEAPIYPWYIRIKPNPGIGFLWGRRGPRQKRIGISIFRGLEIYQFDTQRLWVRVRVVGGIAKIPYEKR